MTSLSTTLLKGKAAHSAAEASRSGEYVDADVVVDQLQRKLDAARARIATALRTPMVMAALGRGLISTTR